jgi:hypothetical protein
MSERPSPMPVPRRSNRPEEKVIDVENPWHVASDEQLRAEFPEFFTMEKYADEIADLLDLFSRRNNNDEIIAVSVRSAVASLISALKSAEFAYRIDYEHFYFNGKKTERLTAIVKPDNVKKVLDGLALQIESIDRLNKTASLIFAARKRIDELPGKIKRSEEEIERKRVMLEELLSGEDADRRQREIDRLTVEAGAEGGKIKKWESQKEKLGNAINSLLEAVEGGDSDLIDEELMPLEDALKSECQIVMILRPALEDLLNDIKGEIRYTANFPSVVEKADEVKEVPDVSLRTQEDIKRRIEEMRKRSRTKIAWAAGTFIASVIFATTIVNIYRQGKHENETGLSSSGKNKESKTLKNAWMRTLEYLQKKRELSAAEMSRISRSKSLDELFGSALPLVNTIQCGPVYIKTGNKKNYVPSGIVVRVNAQVQELAAVVYGEPGDVGLIMGKGVVLNGMDEEGNASLLRRQFCTPGEKDFVSVRFTPSNSLYKEFYYQVSQSERFKACEAVREELKKALGMDERINGDGSKTVTLPLPREREIDLDSARVEVLGFIMTMQKNGVLSQDLDLAGAMAAKNAVEFEKWLVDVFKDNAVEVKVKKGRLGFKVSKALQEGFGVLYGHEVTAGVEQQAHQKSAQERQSPMTEIRVPKASLCSPSFDLGIVVQPGKDAGSRKFYSLDIEPFRKKYCKGRK